MGASSVILKPDGNGKLSKRDGDRLGFPVYAMDWNDPVSGELTKGFKEIGFLSEAFINLLALLGWNDGTEQEIFSKEELIEKFSMERVHKGGAKFDFEKAKWFNHEWIKRLHVSQYRQRVKNIFEENNITIQDDHYLERVMELVKERCVLLNDFLTQGIFFFQSPSNFDEASVKPKWDETKKNFFKALNQKLQDTNEFSAATIEIFFKELATEKNIKVGELQMIFRIMLVGSKMGPAVFVIAETIGKDETSKRIQSAMEKFNQ
ncbi:MAG: glutamate--tRNA ligase family protein [Ferruginibacter sp.]